MYRQGVMAMHLGRQNTNLRSATAIICDGQGCFACLVAPNAPFLSFPVSNLVCLLVGRIYIISLTLVAASSCIKNTRVH